MSDYKNKPWTLRDHDRAASGYVIRTGTDGKPEILARIDIVRSVNGGGMLKLAVYDSGMPNGQWYYGQANGGGYDKLAAAMSGMTIGGIEIGDHSDYKDRQTVDALCYARGWLYLAP